LPRLSDLKQQLKFKTKATFKAAQDVTAAATYREASWS